MRHTSVALAMTVGASSMALAQPLLHYSFDDQADPTANLGTLGAEYDGSIGPGIEFVPFDAGAAIELDDVEDGQVQVLGDQAVFNLADADFSLTAIVVTTNAEPEEPGGRFVINKEKLGADDGWALTVVRESGLAFFAISADGVTAVSVTSVTPVNDGIPHEIVACRAGDYLVIAVDDIVEASTEIPDGFGSTAQNQLGVSIGGRMLGEGSPTGGPNDEFLGTIDEIAIHDVALLAVPCVADCNADGQLNILDFVCFQGEWQSQTSGGDCDANGLFNILDFVCFQSLFQAGCP